MCTCHSPLPHSAQAHAGGSQRRVSRGAHGLYTPTKCINMLTYTRWTCLSINKSVNRFLDAVCTSHFILAKCTGPCWSSQGFVSWGAHGLFTPTKCSFLLSSACFTCICNNLFVNLLWLHYILGDYCYTWWLCFVIVSVLSMSFLMQCPHTPNQHLFRLV